MPADLSYHVLFRPEPEGGFTAIVPSLPGCVTHGRTLEEAERMIADAVEGYLESLRKHGEPIPSDGRAFMGTVHAPRRRIRQRRAVPRSYA
ncbi:MAG: type II toxin-antitoxin system HicB family antitoxin [bacterium]|nr:type II toxin-antitoxin system HicB family antitoxin [bacterium]